MAVPLKYLPMTVTKIDRVTLQRKHITNMEDAVRFLPGVVLSSNQLGPSSVTVSVELLML